MKNFNINKKYIFFVSTILFLNSQSAELKEKKEKLSKEELAILELDLAILSNMYPHTRESLLNQMNSTRKERVIAELKKIDEIKNKENPKTNSLDEIIEDDIKKIETNFQREKAKKERITQEEIYQKNQDISSFISHTSGNLNFINSKGEILIMIATRLYCNNVLDYLLKQGANYLLENNQGGSAIHVAIQHLNLQAFKMLTSFIAQKDIDDLDYGEIYAFLEEVKNSLNSRTDLHAQSTQDILYQMFKHFFDLTPIDFSWPLKNGTA